MLYSGIAFHSHAERFPDRAHFYLRHLFQIILVNSLKCRWSPTGRSPWLPADAGELLHVHGNGEETGLSINLCVYSLLALCKDIPQDHRIINR